MMTGEKGPVVFLLDEATPSPAAVWYCFGGFFYYFCLFVEQHHDAPSSLLLFSHVNWPKSRIIQKAIILLIGHPPKKYYLLCYYAIMIQ